MDEDHQTQTASSRTGPWRKQQNTNYWYAELKKKETKPKRPSVRSLFESESSESSSETVAGTEKHTINRCFSNPTSREIERKLRRQESK
ncbi:hypothetical protein Bca52824_061952 [Brassica carinata]|uniref:Uncharacterized protein n=1 Tax=Brassica carinata TaxID=52824 RepID=A0A8X7QBZ9_BRACI|nr:hypothetical protein Bca52824_061952 [Brassica carinata]